jgi:exonuclease VII large subunit
LYFDLKDDRNVIAAISWKGQVARMQVRTFACAYRSTLPVHARVPAHMYTCTCIFRT